ncbi:non-hydrolyzing UDP-N-acetylglucosamine 2-epimerase [Oerskovia paurometabola]|uniref:non-hydrolyzing UDP-N-acetylglucosamine 2-epimerase n=1 Tax=Oerskovia paurometabola TaxID=162170 RepID=UPI00343938F5
MTLSRHGVPPVVDDPLSTPRVLVVVGTRPEAIKMLPVVQALREHERIEQVVVATGQHPGLVADVLRLAGVEVDADLAIGRPGITLNELFAEVLERLERFCAERFGPPSSSVVGRDIDRYPFACLVHGDTTTAAAAALAAFHLRIPVGHVEAGMRTSSTLSPFPEELNRQLIARIASFHLAPTDVAKGNLVAEGIDIQRVFVTGNTAIDALQLAADLCPPYGVPQLADLEDDSTTRVVVVTAHRRESWGEGLERVGLAIARLAGEYPDVRFVLPLHPNPAVAGTLRPLLEDVPNVDLVAPMGYSAFARLLGRADIAITDSGGIQEEAPALGTAVLVTRESTERTEGVDAGTLELVGTDPDRIVAAARRLLDDRAYFLEVTHRTNPYGDGHAARRIVEAMDHLLFDDPAPVPYGAGFSRGVVLDWAGYEREPTAQEASRPGRGLVDPSPGSPIPDVDTPLPEDVVR